MAISNVYNAVLTCDVCDDQRYVLCPASTGVSLAPCVVSCVSAMLRAT